MFWAKEGTSGGADSLYLGLEHTRQRFYTGCVSLEPYGYIRFKIDRSSEEDSGFGNDNTTNEESSSEC